MAIAVERALLQKTSPHAASETSTRSGFESFTDNCDGLRERTETDAETAFDRGMINWHPRPPIICLRSR
jgi:hypothetical protein